MAFARLLSNIPPPSAIYHSYSSSRSRRPNKGYPTTIIRVELKRPSNKRARPRNKNGNGFLSPADAYYVWKLTSGCIVGGAVIKYGSIFIPGITRPNITQALITIGMPVLASILLLLRASSSQSQKHK